MANGPFVVGSTYKWSPTFLKDGAIYDLTGATVTVNFRSPANVVTSFSMTPISASAGTYTYTNATTLFTAAGQWYRSYSISLSGVVLQSKGIEFQVNPSVAAGF